MTSFFSDYESGSRLATTESTNRVPPFLASIYSNHHVVAPSPSTLGQNQHTASQLYSISSPATATTSSSVSDVSPILKQPSQSVQPPQPPPNALYLPPPALPNLEEDLVPPENFSLVTPGVYRSGFPKKRNFAFMQTLRLKTVLTLVLEDYPQANLEWCQSQDIQFMQFGIPGNKEPFDNIPEDVICSALVAILDVRNHPILIHCNKGKHRTGCLIGCIRRLQSWSLTSIFDEYRRFSSPKSRAVDQQFIDLFDIAPVWDEVDKKGGKLGNLPKWGMLTLPRRRGLGMASSVVGTAAGAGAGAGAANTYPSGPTTMPNTNSSTLPPAIHTEIEKGSTSRTIDGKLINGETLTAQEPNSPARPTAKVSPSTNDVLQQPHDNSNHLVNGSIPSIKDGHGVANGGGVSLVVDEEIIG